MQHTYGDGLVDPGVGVGTSLKGELNVRRRYVAARACAGLRPTRLEDLNQGAVVGLKRLTDVEGHEPVGIEESVLF